MKKKTKSQKSSLLTIEFDNQEAAEHFASWLCGQGEQDYWMWMECREREEDGDITATSFHYHGVEDETKAQDDPSRYGEFMADNTIRTTCGRLDKKKKKKKKE
jgi:ribosomal protein S27AE